MIEKMYSFFKILPVFVAVVAVHASEFETVQFGKGADRYTVFIPSVRRDTSEVVLFLHGHGASNALVYGSWITHILEQGKIVIFPKYQTGWFIPVVSWSQKRASFALTEGLNYLTEERKFVITNVHVIGHSLGGAVAANVVATVQLSAPARFATLALIEPGCWLFRSGRLKSYGGFPADLKLMCITARADWVAGKRFAAYVMDHSPDLPDSSRIHFQVAGYSHKDQSIMSTHFAPAGIDLRTDTHNRNLLIRAAEVVCDTDLTDQRAFWAPVDRLMAGNIPLSACGDLGKWNDGTPIGSLNSIPNR